MSLHHRVPLSAFSAALCAIIGLSSLGAQAQSPLLFSDVTASSGIQWSQIDDGDLMGAGGAWLDFDQDGWQDLLLVGSAAAPALYRNVQGSFVDVTQSSGLVGMPVFLHWIMCATVGDYDNDGYPDIYVGTKVANILWHNNGDGTFSDVTPPALAGAEWTTAAAFGDYDGDGRLDLYLGNYIETLNYPFHFPWANRLFRNLGSAGWQDVTAITGVGGGGTTLAVTWTDFDNDGDVDLMVGNDFGAFVEPNKIYRNDGPSSQSPQGWNFTDVSSAMNANVAVYCMGIAAADLDRDLDLDYYYSNLGRNVLLQNDGALGFSDITASAGIENTMDPTTSNPSLFATSWGVGFHDFDADGWLDLYVSNGHIPSAPSIANGTQTPSSLYHHTPGALSFTEMAMPSGIFDQGVGRAAFFADYDNDGDIDILQSNVSGPARLYRNDAPQPGHWIRLAPQGTTSNRDGMGARVQVDLAGGVSLIRECNRCYSFESSSESAVVFGLGTESTAEKISVRWPSGITQRYYDVSADAAYPLVEPLGSIGSNSMAPPTVREGQVLNLLLEVKNHTLQPLLAYEGLMVQTPQGMVPLKPIGTVAVPPFGSVLVPFNIAIPTGITGPGGTPLPVTLMWSTSDGGLGVDQWKIELTLLP